MQDIIAAAAAGALTIVAQNMPSLIIRADGSVAAAGSISVDVGD